jgi:hypothetical protein
MANKREDHPSCPDPEAASELAAAHYAMLLAREEKRLGLMVMKMRLERIPWCQVVAALLTLIEQGPLQ